MGNLIFTKEDKEKIKKTLALITDDIRLMWQESQFDQLKIDLRNIYGGESYQLFINDRKIGLLEYGWDWKKYYPFERQGRNKSIKLVGDYHLAFAFIENYDDMIRPKIEQQLKKGLYKKGLGFEKLDEVKQHYDKNAEVIFEVGDSNNLPIMILSEEEGKNIGTLYLGERALKIVVDGPIKIVNKTNQEELAHVKRK